MATFKFPWDRRRSFLRWSISRGLWRSPATNHRVAPYLGDVGHSMIRISNPLPFPPPFLLPLFFLLSLSRLSPMSFTARLNPCPSFDELSASGEAVPFVAVVPLPFFHIFFFQNSGR